jgi:hypothetical protein
MRFALSLTMASAAAFLTSACTGDPSAPTPSESASLSPNQNLEVILRGDGFGLVKFRQPKDEEAIVYLDTWVRGLAPNTSYQLQRAVDTSVDDLCTGTGWLTLGRGGVPQTITTDDRGTGREALFRNLTSPPGSAFEIRFRVIDATTQAVVLESGCYQFKVSL